MIDKEFVLQVVRIFYPGHKTWLVKTLVIAGLGLICRPFWEPILIGLLKDYVELDIPDADWVGWVLLAIGLSVYALNEWIIRFNKAPSSKDIQLFEFFFTYFAENDRIRFYKEHDFLAPFDSRYLEPLNEFVETWDNAAHQFVDRDLEKAREKLYESAKALGLAIAGNTVPDRHGRISVVPDHMEKPLPDWVKRDAKEINELAPTFVEHHENFIRLGRKKLYGS